MKVRHLVWLRRFSQALFLFLFLFLLIESRLPGDASLDYSAGGSFSEDSAALESTASDLRIGPPVTFFFQLDPLVFVTSLLSDLRLIPGYLWALAILGLTLFLGRFFCGFICPFGTVHHLVGHIRPAVKGRRRMEANQKRADQRLKYFLLITVLVGAILGLNLAGVLDPLALFFRSMALGILPGIGAGMRSLFGALAASDYPFISTLGYRIETFLSPVLGYDVQAFQTGGFIGLIFLVILFLNRLRPRVWCRTLCPLGALLGLCARVGVLRLEKDPHRCTDCQRCMRHCQGAASPHPDLIWESAECLTCFNCQNNCPEDALAFRIRPVPKFRPAPDTGRRAVLGGLTAGLALPLLGRVDGRIDKISDPRLIRPPGSQPEKTFLALCQRCGLCMKVCPTNVINPTLGEAGMAGFWTPRLIMTQGYCDYTCTLCGSVCPTGAITPITARQKIETPVKTGSAYLDRGRCLPWSGNFACIVCEEHCPTSPKAIYLQQETITGADGKRMQVQLPFVDLKRCVGCGICENKCPVRGLPAIRTTSAGETRAPENQILL